MLFNELVWEYTSIIESINQKFADRFLASLQEELLQYKNSGLHIVISALGGIVVLKITGDGDAPVWKHPGYEKIAKIEAFLQESDWGWVRYLHNATLL